MKILHTFVAAAGLAGLAACAPADDQQNNVGLQDDNVMVVDNLVVNEVVTDDLMMNGMNDMNAMGANTMDLNATDNAATNATGNTGY